jgi:hypothetical protein
MNMDKKIRTICTQDPVDLERHSRKCVVCRHPDRDAIEEAFLQWRGVGGIAVEFDLDHESSIYRHAHALGLFAHRRRNMRLALELMIENAGSVDPTALGIISAIRACSRLNDDGVWIDAPTTHIILTGDDATRLELTPTPSVGASAISLQDKVSLLPPSKEARSRE